MPIMRSTLCVVQFAIAFFAPLALPCAGAISLLTTTMLSVAIADNSREIEQILANWQRAEVLSMKCSGDSTWVTTWNSPSDNAGRPPRRLDYSYKLNAPDVLQQIVFNEGEEREEQLVGVNKDYGFRLRREDNASPWELQWVGTDTEPLRRTFERDGKVCALYWLYIDGKYLSDLLRNPAFHIRDVVFDSSGKSTLIRFNCDEIPHENQTWWVREGTIAVTNDSLSTVSRVQLTCRHDGVDFNSVRENQFAFDPNDTPYLVRQTYQSSTGIVEERSYRNVFFGSVPRDQFYLEAYGLKFGGLQTPSRFSPFFLINVIAVAVIAVALALRLMHRNKKSFE